MNSLKTISTEQASTDHTLIDIRDPDEFAREHIKGAINIPVSTMAHTPFKIDASKQVVFYCRSGNRTEMNCEQLSQYVKGEGLLLGGGITAWKAAGLPVTQNKSAPMEIQRQVQITAGFLAFAGALLGFFVNPLFFGLAAFIGAGLMLSGLTGSCAMGLILGKMPWNRRAAT